MSRLLSCAEPQPRTDEGASCRRGESRGLGLRGPVAIYPGEVEDFVDSPNGLYASVIDANAYPL
jgi:hypothetical protein